MWAGYRRRIRRLQKELVSCQQRYEEALQDQYVQDGCFEQLKEELYQTRQELENTRRQLNSTRVDNASLSLEVERLRRKVR